MFLWVIIWVVIAYYHNIKMYLEVAKKIYLNSQKGSEQMRMIHNMRKNL